MALGWEGKRSLLGRFYRSRSAPQGGLQELGKCDRDTSDSGRGSSYLSCAPPNPSYDFRQERTLLNVYKDFLQGLDPNKVKAEPPFCKAFEKRGKALFVLCTKWGHCLPTARVLLKPQSSLFLLWSCTFLQVLRCDPVKFSVYWGHVLGSSLTRAGIAGENHVGPWEGLCLA